MVFYFTLFLSTITSVLAFNVWSYDKGPNDRQEQQYVSHPYSSVEEECAKARVIVERCSKGERGVEQYTTCDYKTNFWKPTLRVIKCTYPKMKCKENYNEDIKTYAECIDDTRKPPFPATGSISWKGTVVYDSSNFYWRPRIGSRKQTAYIHGRIWKDDQGNFYRMESLVEKWPGKGTRENKEPPVLKTAFEVIKPGENGKFVKYEGHEVGQTDWSDNEQVCDFSETKKEGSLSSIWQPFRFYSSYKLTNRSVLIF